jgi:branched-chain amino acid transport system substrate-binding protein
MSSVYAVVGGKGSITAAQMAVEDFGSPTVAGARIEIVSADHQNKPDIASALVQRWFDVGGVDVVADGGSTPSALAIQRVAQEKRKVFMSSGSGSTDLVGKACSPTGFHWAYDNYALANGAAHGVVQSGGDSWFFITADYAFGHSLEVEATKRVLSDGGHVLGAVRAPLDTADFSSFLLQAQASKSKIVGLANAATDMEHAVKQAHEFGITQGGQRLVALMVLPPDVDALGLDIAQGLQSVTANFDDMNEAARAFAKRFIAKEGHSPTMIQAGTYSSVLHYLRAVAVAGTDDGPKVADRMRAMKVNDFMDDDVSIREDGQVMRNMYLVEVKTPAESKGRWDYFKLKAIIPPGEAWRPPIPTPVRWSLGRTEVELPLSLPAMTGSAFMARWRGDRSAEGPLGA